ncbi:MAG: hypothetical protein KGY56_02910 [Desulfobacterales bacterium]|nr:hypothetical protein [Desulfobacterales bacterium]
MKSLQTLALYLLLAMLLAGAGTCGKKGSPEAPQPPQFTAVENLKIARGDSVLILSWSLAEEGKQGEAAPAGFFVYRAKTPVESDCLECPHRYEKITRVARREGRVSSETWQFRDRPEPGYVYRYQVRCYNRRGTQGEPSSPVKYVMTRDGANDGSR